MTSQIDANDFGFLRKTIQIVCLIAFSCLMQNICYAQSDSSDALRRFGIGWDDGIGMRYRLDQHWGVGLMLGGSYDNSTDRSSESDPYSGDTSYTGRYIDGEFRVTGAVYRQARINRFLEVGPCLLIQASHGSQHQAGYEEIWNGAAFQISLRPVFTFWSRFALETRIGVEVSHRYTVTRNHLYGYDRRRNTWQLGAFGRGLGPGAVMQFMVYF